MLRLCVTTIKTSIGTRGYYFEVKDSWSLIEEITIIHSLAVSACKHLNTQSILVSSIGSEICQLVDVVQTHPEVGHDITEAHLIGSIG